MPKDIMQPFLYVNYQIKYRKLFKFEAIINKKNNCGISVFHVLHKTWFYNKSIHYSEMQSLTMGSAFNCCIWSFYISPLHKHLSGLQEQCMLITRLYKQFVVYSLENCTSRPFLLCLFLLPTFCRVSWQGWRAAAE